MTTKTNSETAREVAHVIKRQIGVMGLATVGASDFLITTEQGGGLTFKARLHVNGGSRARVCRVTVTLTPMDTYEVVVAVPGRSKYDAPTMVTVAEHAHGNDLTTIMVGLDSHGVSTR